MAALLVHLCQNVEQKWLHVEVEGLVVQEQFGRQTEVLAVDLVVTAIHFKHRYGTLRRDKEKQRKFNTTYDTCAVEPLYGGHPWRMAFWLLYGGGCCRGFLYRG